MVTAIAVQVVAVVDAAVNQITELKKMAASVAIFFRKQLSIVGLETC